VTLEDRLADVHRLLTEGLFLRAEEEALAILAEHPESQAAALLRGLSVAAMGEVRRAVPLLMEIALANPAATHPCTEFARLRPPFPRGLVGRLFQACLALAPNDARLRLAYAEFLIDTDQAARAETMLADAPDSTAAHHLRGLALGEQGRFDEAAAAFRQAVALNPDAAASWSNLGMMLKIEGRFPEAFAAHDRAVALAPRNAHFRVNRAVAHLKAGDWTRAWPDYEARLSLPEASLFDPTRLLPELRPGDSLMGTTVIAMHEDGYGDTLQFSRYLILLAERGARVLACVPHELERIMRGIPGVADVLTDARSLPPHDFVCPMFSLPAVFRSTIATVPPTPTLAIADELRRRWAYRLPAGAPMKVGIAWAGQARPWASGFAALDRRRSAGLAAFEPLFQVPGVYFIGLQKGAAAREKRPVSLTLFDPMPRVRDFADTAAIMASLDLVISVDTSVVHLAGLVGVPVFLMDRYDNCWRWLHGRSDSPWYPKLTIFRQDRPNDWSGAMARAAAALQAMLLFRGETPRGPLPDGLHEPALVA
jgi:tetratricopeptide (TPR) repeat protein